MRKTLHIAFVLLMLIHAGQVSAAKKYWVGGSGEWGDMTHWSDESGGLGGTVQLPSTGDEVIIDANSFKTAGSIFMNGNAVMGSIQANPLYPIEITSLSEGTLVIKNSFLFSGQVTNSIQMEAHVFNDHVNGNYHYYRKGTFLGLRKNPVTKPQDAVLAPTGITTNVINQLCPGDETGSIKVTPIGGTGPFGYQWVLQPTCSGGDGLETDSVFNVCSGEQTVIVIDSADNPLDPQVYTVNMGPAPFSVLILGSTNVTCGGANDGTIEALVLGGTPPYQYSWTNGAPAVEDPTGLAGAPSPGILYTLTVTDDNGCVSPVTPSRAIIEEPPLIVTPVLADVPICSSNGCTEDVTFNVSGGDGGPYNMVGINGTVLLNPAAPFHLEDICPGSTYDIEVSDNSGCPPTVYSHSATVPAVVIDALITATPVPCGSTACNLDAFASATGGVGPYDFVWTSEPGNPTTTTISSKCPGDFLSITATDQQGCQATYSGVISPNNLTINIDLQSNIICAGQTNGRVELSTSGGAAPYSYDWYDMTGSPVFNANQDSVGQLAAGTYHVAVEDAAGCQETLQVVITEPAPIAISVDRQVNNTCLTNCLGEVDISFSGGQAPVNYMWTDSNGLAPVDPQLLNLTGLCDGSYVFEVIDDNGCSAAQNIQIASPVVTVNFSMAPVCPGDISTNVQVLASGGTAPYAYTWLDPVPGGVNDNVQVGIGPGAYQVRVDDDAGCSTLATFSWSTPLPFNTSAVTANSLCKGVCDGAIDVTLAGATPPYDVEWYNMVGTPTTQDVSNVCTGTYHLAVRDNFGCRDTLFNVTVNPTIVLAGTPEDDPTTCTGVCDGKGWITVANGLPNYSYNWYDDPAASATDTIFNACAGNYNVEVIDNQGCTDTFVVAVSAQPAVSASIINQVNNVCSQDCNGEAEVQIVGGLAPFDIVWPTVTGAPTTAAVTGLCVRTYDVEITDANGCQASATANITSASATATFATADPSCGGYNDGSITANLTGGAAPLDLLWLNVPGNPTSNSLSGMVQGSYDLEVRDAAGCVDTFQATLTDPFPAIDLQGDSQTVSCFGVCDGKAWATPTGGSAPFQYSWYNDPGGSIIDTAFNLCVGNYFVAVLDNDGCRDTTSIAVTNPFSIDLTLNAKDPCFGICDGRLDAVVVGGPGPFQYLWNDPGASTADTAVGLCAGDYKVFVTNGNGCLDSAEATISENPEITATLDTTRALCTNTTNGAALITASGGALPYAYQWTDNVVYTSNSPNPSDLGIGKYYVTVTDGIGCTYIDSVVIEETYFIDANVGGNFAICAGQTAQLIATGGDSYLWNTGVISDTLIVTPAASNLYSVEATVGPCVDQDEVFITINDNPDAVATSDQGAVLENMTTVLHASGGGLGGTYDWNPANLVSDPTDPDASTEPTLSNTTYTVTVTDANGCSDTASVFVEVIESIVFPDGVSPNGDGVNDDWPIVYIENFPGAVVTIYNRWGQIVFHSVGYPQRWNGKQNGKVLPVGTYYFTIDLGQGLPKYSGPITLFR